ncbi:MAG: hypothetical protein DRP11_03950 [Candidatus Aenigmatarchaeota archaeon]|nr:MAG: hypothetical protein DRP11_03950 [Candidatus Aenigmarchaeota archaeon]
MEKKNLHSEFFQQWLMEDFRARIKEIELRIQLRQTIVHYGLVALGGITALLSVLLTKKQELSMVEEWVSTINLAAGFFFLSFSLWLLRHDLFIAYNAQYIEEHIRKMLPSGLLRWERFLSEKRGGECKCKRVCHLLLALARVVPMVMPSLGFIGIGIAKLNTQWEKFLDVQSFASIAWSILTGGLFVVDSIGVVLLFVTMLWVANEENKIRKLAYQEGSPDSSFNQDGETH